MSGAEDEYGKQLGLRAEIGGVRGAEHEVARGWRGRVAEGRAR